MECIRKVLFLALLATLGCSAPANPGKPASTPDIDADSRPIFGVAETSGDTSAGPGDWPKFLGPFGTSVSPEKGIISPWPEKGLKVVWSKKVGTGYAMPVISKGKLYHFDRHGNKARLTCMNAATGAEHWHVEYATDYRDRYNYNNGPRCSPVVDGDLVFCHGVEGMLHCFSAKDGKTVWKVDEVEDFGVVQNFFGVGSTPVVEGELVIVQVGGSPPGSSVRDFGSLKGNKSGVVAFEKRTGKVRYSISDELASYASPTLATIGGRRWCFVFARGGLLAFEPATGEIDFHFPWRAPDYESVNASNPVVIGDKVFISETYGPGAAMLKVRPGGYDVLWSDAGKPRKSMQCHWMTPIYHDGCIYGSSGRHDYNAELRCIDAVTGKVLWKEPRLTRSSLLMVDNHFICLSEDGMVRLLKVNANKFDVVSEWKAIDPRADDADRNDPCWAAPILVNGLLYLRGGNQIVCAELIKK